MNKANLAWGAVVAVLTAIFGRYWFLFAGFLIFNVLDYASGTYRDWVKESYQVQQEQKEL